MPVTIQIDPETGLRTHTVTGDLSLPVLVEALETAYERPDFKAEANVLWDLREAKLGGFSADEIRGVAEYVKRHWGQSPGARAALVVARDLDPGLARMYELLLDSRVKGEIMVFRDHDEARTWVEG